MHRSATGMQGEQHQPKNQSPHERTPLRLQTNRDLTSWVRLPMVVGRVVHAQEMGWTDKVKSLLLRCQSNGRFSVPVAGETDLEHDSQQEPRVPVHMRNSRIASVPRAYQSGGGFDRQR